jgi:cell division protein FtsA
LRTRKSRYVASIDIGSTKVCAFVAVAEGSGLKVVGMGLAPARGLRQGMVTNLSETIDSIRLALERAESQSETVIESAYVSVGGEYLQGMNCSGIAEISGRNREVTSEDIQKAAKDASNVEIPKDFEVVHVLTQRFQVDGQDGISDPLGMSGRQLGVNLHVVINASAVLRNIISAVNKAGVVVDGVAMQQLASSESILSEDEKELGTFVVDIGGGTTDIAFYSHGAVWYSGVVPQGGDFVTKDIAIGIKAPISEAEEIKKNMGNVFPENVPLEEIVEVTEVGSGAKGTIPRQLLCRIIQARCDELLNRVAKIIREVGTKTDLSTGVVLTGGGAMLEGLRDRAELIFKMPVRLGYPVNLAAKGDSTYHPAFCTGLGLLKYAHDLSGSNGTTALPSLKNLVSKRSRLRRDRMRNWFLEKIS